MGNGLSVTSKNETWAEYAQRIAAEQAKTAEANKPENRGSTIFKGLTETEVKILTAYAAKKMEFHEQLGTSLALGAGMGILLPNLKEFTHPFSAGRSVFSKNSMTNTVFNETVRKSDLWKNNASIMQEAYSQLHKAEIRHGKWSWQGLFKRGFTDDEILKLSTKLESAIATGKADDILKATAEIQAANGIKGGHIPRAWATVKSWFGGAKPTTTSIDDVLTTLNKAVPDAKGNMVTPIKGSMDAIKAATNVMTFKDSLKVSVGGKIGLLFAATSILSELKFIKAGFKKDSETGWKQLGQSIAKAGSSWGGYLIGETLGRWGGAKLGAVIGTAICPGLGTAIGAVGGVLLGTISSWGLRKFTNWAVGDNVANDEIVQKDFAQAANNKEKQSELISNLCAQATNDEDLDQQTAVVLEKARQLYCIA